MSASSGLRKIEPIFGASPLGRNSFFESLNAAKRTSLSRVCWRNVSSTLNPRRATLVAGASASPSDSVPQLPSALSQVARVPGVPTLAPLVTRSGVKV